MGAAVGAAPCAVLPYGLGHGRCCSGMPSCSNATGEPALFDLGAPALDGAGDFSRLRLETPIRRLPDEGFWSIFKRGVVGTFRKMSRKYMPLYVAEFQFR
jgi:ISXO2 transposase-like protein